MADRPAAYPAIGYRRPTVHLAAASTIAIAGRRQLPALRRQPGQPLCRSAARDGRARRPLRPVPGTAPTCRPCLAIAARYSIANAGVPRPVPRLAAVSVRAARHPGRPVHLAAVDALTAGRIIRQPGELLCWPPGRRTSQPAPGAAITCQECTERAAHLGWQPPPPPRPRCSVPGCPFRAPCPEHDRPDPLPRDPWARLRDRIAASIAEATAHPELPAELPAGLAAVRSSTGLVHAIAAAPLAIARDGSAAEVRRDPGQLLCATRCPPATCPADGWPTCGLCSARAARVAAELAASQPAGQATR